MPPITALCVYCGSSAGARPEYLAAAQELGALLGKGGTRLVYGGARVGLMGAVADACLAQGGHVTGVIPRVLVDKEIAHKGLTTLEVVGSMHERKQRMMELADAFVALPGGYGTLEEIFEALTWGQLRLHSKPCAFLNLAGYYDHMAAMLDRMVEDQFLRPELRAAALSVNRLEDLLPTLETWKPTYVDKWIINKKPAV